MNARVILKPPLNHPEATLKTTLEVHPEGNIKFLKQLILFSCDKQKTKGVLKMSVEAAKKFLEKMTKDEKFIEQVNGATEEELAKLGKTIGASLEFTKEELQMAIAANRELSDEDLEKVAGGGLGLGDFFKKLGNKFENLAKFIWN
ncbi:MAG: Nif11-like leader peptide family RiPP precursor [Synergistaceae bacterium]|nr:Nif11-like leader peptide family RiPP precursor [Synergistaceae bacterium]